MTKKQSNMLMFMCWLLYVSAYLGRYSYNSNQLPISLFYKVSDTEVALATSFFFFAYGAGQIINGILCKFYNVKYVLSGSLIVSSLINLSVFLGIPFSLIKFAWLLNGIAQSVLWSSLLMTLAKNLEGKYIKTSIIVMSTTASIGTLLSYGLSAVFALFDGFKFSFLTGAVLMTVSAVIWILIYDKITVKKSERVAEVKDEQPEKVKTKTKIHPTVIYVFIVFGFFAIIINLMKDGLTSWVPKIMFDQFGLDESLSILVTLLLPVLTVFGTTFVVTLNKKIKEHTALMAIVFALACLMTIVVILLFDTSLWVVVLIALALTSLFMSGANNIVTSMIPLELKDKANSGFVGGILNGCCYVGSTLSSIVLGAMSDAYGWKPAFTLFLILCSAVVLVGVGCTVATALRRKNQIKIANIEQSLDPDSTSK